jgi:hypothetical protein
VSAFINEKLVAVKSNAGKSRLYVDYPYPQNPRQFPVPQTVFTDAAGKEIDRIVGYLAPAQFKAQMQSILSGLVS